MTLKELREQKKENIFLRMENAMYENYFGGDTICVRNLHLIVDHGITTESRWFTSNELKFIERENALDKLKEHWDIKFIKEETDEDVEWLFTEKK